MYAVRRPVENVYLVRERDRRRTRELLALTMAALPPLAVLFAAIWANLETYQVGYQLGRLSRQREVLLERKRQLLVEKAQASSLTRVEAIARGKLGLAPPKPGQLILVRDASLGPAATPAPPPRAAAPRADDPIGPPAPPPTAEGF